MNLVKIGQKKNYKVSNIDMKNYILISKTTLIKNIFLLIKN